MEQAIIRRLKDGTLAPYREAAKAKGRSLEVREDDTELLYAALAIREDCRVATADEALIAAMERGGLGGRAYRI